MNLRADEFVLHGHWTALGAAHRADTTCDRIEWLLAHALERVASSPQWGDWEVLYRDPGDGRYWELTYPQGELQGGGPPQLQALPAAAAARKYSIETNR